MTQEQKAKAYDEALEKARKRVMLEPQDHTDAILKDIFPQLAESEDERIREKMIRYFTEMKEGGSAALPYDDCIAYLEKQKEASKAIEAVERIDKYIDEHVENAHDMKDSHPDKKYCQGIDDTLAGIAGILQDVYSNEKQKEQRPNMLQNAFDKSKKDYTLEEKSKASDYAESILPTSIMYGENEEEYKLHTIIEAAFIAGQEDQKPTWSEEDERMLNQLICDVEHHKKEGLISAKQNKATKALYNGIEKCYDEKIAWLKSFRPQPKQEWSEKGEKILDSLIRLYGGEYSAKAWPWSDGVITYGDVVNFLKSLRPSWKPSKEQMGALKDALETYKGFEEYDAMKSLYNELKKLM